MEPRLAIREPEIKTPAEIAVCIRTLDTACQMGSIDAVADALQCPRPGSTRCSDRDHGDATPWNDMDLDLLDDAHRQFIGDEVSDCLCPYSFCVGICMRGVSHPGDESVDNGDAIAIDMSDEEYGGSGADVPADAGRRAPMA